MYKGKIKKPEEINHLDFILFRFSFLIYFVFLKRKGGGGRKKKERKSCPAFQKGRPNANLSQSKRSLEDFDNSSIASILMHSTREIGKYGVPENFSLLLLKPLKWPKTTTEYLRTRFVAPMNEGAVVFKRL